MNGLEQGKKIIKDKIPLISKNPGIYKMLSSTGEILYIGKAKNIPNRLKSYVTESNLPIRTERMLSLTHNLEVTTTNNESEALLLEANLIKKHKPRFNILLRDDKSFPYIYIGDKDKWPQLTKLRGKKSKSGPSDRIDEYSYTGKNGDQYTLTEDITTGDAQITKDKMGIGSSGDKTFDVIEDRTVMDYKTRKQDVDVETRQTIDEAAEYDEYKVEFDQDGTAADATDIDEFSKKELIEEAGDTESLTLKRAGGGVAYMLGQ